MGEVQAEVLLGRPSPRVGMAEFGLDKSRGGSFRQIQATAVGTGRLANLLQFQYVE